MHEFPYSSAPKFKTFQTSHCTTGSEVMFVPFHYMHIFLLYPFSIDRRPHHTYRITSQILNWQTDMSGLLCLNLNCAKSRYSRLTWQPDSPHCGYCKDRQTDITYLPTCTLQQKKSSSRRAQCWRWANTILQTGSWDLRKLWCHGKFRTCIIYKEEITVSVCKFSHAAIDGIPYINLNHFS